MTNSITLLQRFVQLWSATWKNPNDRSHEYIEFYEYANAIIAIHNNIQEDIAAWLLGELDERWDFDNERDGNDDDDLSPEWLQLHRDIKQYLEA